MYSPLPGYAAYSLPIVCNEMEPSIWFEDDLVVIYSDDGGCKSNLILVHEKIHIYTHSRLYSVLHLAEIVELSTQMVDFPIKVEQK